MGDWLTLKDAAKLAGYHVEHLRELLREGKVKARKVVTVWLVSKSSLTAYLREQDKRGERRGRKPSHN
jgi:excisionase family DNA binding protein